MKIKSLVLVAVQVAGIAVICATAKPYCTQVALLVIQSISLLLLIWTWMHLRLGKFNIQPETKENASLVTSGPFRWIRHPMYLSLFLYLVPLVIEYYNWWRMLVLLAFLANMMVKLLYEEKILQQKFPEYSQYMKRSKRLVPYIF